MYPEETQNIDSYDPDSITRRSYIWAFILFTVNLTLIIGLSIYVITDNNAYYPYQITSSLSLIRALYPDQTNSTKLIEQARDAIFDDLDRYSGYIEEQQFNQIAEEFTGSYSGIGITVIGHDKGLLIMSVREDGPAGKAGVQTGDIIIRTDSTSLEGMTPSKASFLLRGDENSRVEIEVIRPSVKDTIVFNLTRKTMRLIHIPYAGLTSNGTLYIRILDFEAGVYDELVDILDSLYLGKEDSVNSIIVDLRGNPGGLLGEVADIAGLFLKDGELIVGIKGRSIWNHREFKASGGDIFEGKPVAVLTDRGSASASEIFAGSLKYAGRAFLVGDTTFGKGLVQQYSRYSDGSGLRLTTSRYYFTGEKYINNPDDSVIDSAAGIPPDYYIKAEDRYPFPMWLERSGLMRQFAVDNADEITALKPFTSESERWSREFKKFASGEKFDYESDLTKLAIATRDEVHLEGLSDATYRAIDDIVELSRAEDQAMFDKYDAYIKARLFQIAVETRYGSAEGYRLAVVPYRKEIILAEKYLQENLNK